MYEGATRVHFIFAGKFKKSELLYNKWLNVVGVIPFIMVSYLLLQSQKVKCIDRE